MTHRPLTGAVFVLLVSQLCVDGFKDGGGKSCNPNTFRSASTLAQFCNQLFIRHAPHFLKSQALWIFICSQCEYKFRDVRPGTFVN